MRKHGGTPSRRDRHVTLAAISPPDVARGRFVGGQQSGVAGCKPPPLFTRGASSCSSQGRRQGEPRGASPLPSAPTYLPLCPYPQGRRLAVPREVACCCGDGSGQGSLSPGAVPACRLPSPRCEDCLGPSAGRTVVGGFCTCQRRNPFPVVAPVGALRSYGATHAWEAPGRLETAAASGLRRDLGSPGIQGCPRCCAPAWSHGCAGLRAGATASVVHSFHPGCRPPYAP